MRLAVGTFVILLGSIITLLIFWPEAPSSSESQALDVPAERADALRRAVGELEESSAGSGPRSEVGALLSGVVLDAESQRPLAGARVVATVEEKRGFSAGETESDGQFVLPCAGNLDLRLEVYHPDYHSVDVKGGRKVEPIVVRLKAGERKTDLVLTVERASTLEGHVVDSKEQPLAGARIELWRSGEEAPVNEEPIVSDESGQFRATRLLAGDYRLRVEAGSRPELVADRVTLEPRESRRVTLPVADGVNLRGTVVDANDAPLAGLLIGLVDPRGSGEAVFTGLDGSFEIPHLRPGAFELRIQSVDPDRQLPISRTHAVTIEEGTDEQRLEIRLD